MGSTAEHSSARSSGPVWDRSAAIDGIRALLPLALPAPFFGLVLGVQIGESPLVDNTAGWASSWLIFGGASQLAAVTLLNAGGSAVLAVLTVLAINSRHIMYSAALQPRFRDAPLWFRYIGPYVLVDQVFATSDARSDDDSMAYRVSFYLVSGVCWFLLWNLSVLAGILVGNVVPASWSFDFAVPLMFLGLMVNALKDRPGIVAAAISGVIAVMARDLEPAGSGLLVGALCGMTVAALLDWRLESGSDEQTDHSLKNDR